VGGLTLISENERGETLLETAGLKECPPIRTLTNRKKSHSGGGKKGKKDKINADDWLNSLWPWDLFQEGGDPIVAGIVGEIDKR